MKNYEYYIKFRNAYCEVSETCLADLNLENHQEVDYFTFRNIWYYIYGELQRNYLLGESNFNPYTFLREGGSDERD